MLATGGVLHPTGYPLFTLVGHGFVVLLHALGISWPRAANAWSGVGGGLALFLYHRLALRWLPSEPGPGRLARFGLAALPVLLLGFNPVWTAVTTIAEVHSWHVAWVIGLALFLDWEMEALRRGTPVATDLARHMGVWGLICGVGMGHHVTAVFFVAIGTVVLGWGLARRGLFRWWVPLLWLGGGMLPLLSYGYLWYMASRPGESVVWPMLEPTFHGLLNHVTALSYRQYLGGWNPETSERSALISYVYPFLWPGLALYAWHTVVRRRSPTWGSRAGFLLASTMLLLFTFHYGVTDPSSYFLPCLAVALLALVPTGWAALCRLRRRRPATLLSGIGTAAALAILIVPWVHTARVHTQALVEIDELLLGMWRSIPFESGIVLWPNGNYYRLKEYQKLGNEKPAIDVYATAVICNDYPRRMFIQKYGFDPLGNNDAAHLAEPLKPEFVIGQQTSPDEARFFARIHETIINRAPVPVAAFDAPVEVRVYAPRIAR